MLKTQDLAYQWDHQKIFQDISFILEPAQVLRVGGANGAGKTTLLKVLAGLLKPSVGHYSYNSNRKSNKYCFDYLPASYNGLFLELTAKENLEFWLKLYKEPADNKSLDLILQKWLPMKSHYIQNLAVKKFSTGMRRRLSFARIEACKRPCLLLDEPTSGLDKDGLALLENLLKEHTKKDGSAIVVTHDTAILKQDLQYQTIELSSL